MPECAKIQDKALQILDQRMFSTGELFTKLCNRGYSEELVGSVIGHFIEVGILDDRKFARAIIDTEMVTKARSKFMAVKKLRQRRFDDLTIMQVVNELDDEPGFWKSAETAEREFIRKKCQMARLGDFGLKTKKSSDAGMTDTNSADKDPTDTDPTDTDPKAMEKLHKRVIGQCLRRGIPYSLIREVMDEFSTT